MLAGTSLLTWSLSWRSGEGGTPSGSFTRAVNDPNIQVASALPCGDLLQVTWDVPDHNILMALLPSRGDTWPTPTASLLNFHTLSWCPQYLLVLSMCHLGLMWGLPPHHMGTAATGRSSDFSWGRQSPLQHPPSASLSHSEL